MSHATVEKLIYHLFYFVFGTKIKPKEVKEIEKEDEFARAAYEDLEDEQVDLLG